MQIKQLTLLLPLLALVSNSRILAQDNDKADSHKFYKLEFVIRESDGGKTISSHSYSMTIAAPNNAKSEIRTGIKVPFMASPSQWMYNDVGTNFDCFNIREVPAGLSLSVVAEVNSVLEATSVPYVTSNTEKTSTAESGHQVIRHNQWNSTVVIGIKKPTVIFASDDPTSKRQMQVELTATPIQ